MGDTGPTRRVLRVEHYQCACGANAEERESMFCTRKDLQARWAAFWLRHKTCTAVATPPPEPPDRRPRRNARPDAPGLVAWLDGLGEGE